MGRKRKDGDPLGLAGTRVYLRRGKFYYAPRDGSGWQMLPTTDHVEARRIGLERLAAEEEGQAAVRPGTMAYWFNEFLKDCAARVKSKQLSQRTLDDYTGYARADGLLIEAFGKRRPETIEPHHVQSYLNTNAKFNPPRLTQSNRERAFLSSCISWLIRENKVPGLKINPCMRGSGVKRNRETARERYVTDAEYTAVYLEANRAVRLAMELEYRTLQRPEVDILSWTAANVKVQEGQKVLHFRQNKTGKLISIALVGTLGALVDEAIGKVPVLGQPILHTLKGEAYTYDGISAMLKQAIAKVRAKHAKTGGPLKDMPSFGLRDLKGKGATDMWLAGERIERIQLLCGHRDAKTTEIYVKARWTQTAQPNNREVSAG